MSNFTCIICGNIVSSKCPNQRSIFSGQEQAMVDMVMSTSVIPVADDHQEIFFNYTNYGSKESGISNALDFMASHKELLKNNACTHHYVMNSETERRCQLGCDHHNLSDKKELLAEKTPKFKVVYEDVQRAYSDELSKLIHRGKTDLMRLIPVGEEHKSFYFNMQDEYNYLASEVYAMFSKVKREGTWRKKYRVTFGYKSDFEEIYTNDFGHATTLYKAYQREGIECNLQEHTIQGTHSSYVDFDMEPDMRLKCCICGEKINGADKLVAAETHEMDDNFMEHKVRTLGSVAHSKCDKQKRERTMEITRSVTITLTEDELDNYTTEKKYHDDSTALKKAVQSRLKEFRHLEILDIRHRKSYKELALSVKGYGHDIEAIKAK